MPAAPQALWHITLQIGGDPAPGAPLDRALRRLCALDPGNMGARYTATAAQLQFWDEGPALEQVVADALELWRRSRGGAGLPDWPAVGIEVVQQEAWLSARQRGRTAIAPGSVAPFE